MRSERTAMKLLPLLACLTLTITACPLDDDPGFDDWCGVELCHWTLLGGPGVLLQYVARIHRVPNYGQVGV